MSQYLPDYSYTPAEYQISQWQGVLGTLMGVAILIAMAAWAFSLVRKAIKGEEVKYPL
ncbi:cytosine permease [Dehalococcoides mccartyi]|uniref:cytosine permease n=1 Tax=Dehalococcoides mccartyi TaxID=61435 RepID=UPI0008054260|nr:cytosine permease [Dehalococcoides mccartyi]OBW61908.1 MAG: cytosine permease [Dehalococcoides mccartyi]